MSTTRSGLVAIVLVAALCSCTSDNVQWAFVSNPGGSFDTSGGAVIVIRFDGSTAAAAAAGGQGTSVRLAGTDARGAVSVTLPLRGDVAVLDHGDSVEVRSPVLAFADAARRWPPRVDLPGASAQVQPAGAAAALRVSVPDCGLVHPAGFGAGTLHVSADGTLLVLESLAGIVVFGEGPEPEQLGLSAALTTDLGGAHLALRLLDGRVRVLVPPPLPVVEQRMTSDPRRGSLRVLGPVGEGLAEVPAAAVTLHGGTDGLFLSVDLPEGLPGDTSPMRLLMAHHNRYLLRVDG